MKLTNYPVPTALLNDELIGVFGEREMELAVQYIIRLVIEKGTWCVKLVGPMFSGISNADYALDGFYDLIEHGWLVRGDGDFYEVHPDMIRRLAKKRPRTF